MTNKLFLLSFSHLALYHLQRTSEQMIGNTKKTEKKKKARVREKLFFLQNCKE